MQLRPLVFWPHLIAGGAAAILILSMSVTGVLLTYERQLIAWSDSHLRSAAPAAGAARLPVETLLETVRRNHPDLAVAAVTIGSAPDATAVLATADGAMHADLHCRWGGV